MVKILNLTPHAVAPEGQPAIPPSGQVARVTSTHVEVTQGFFRTVFGAVEGLPAPQANILLLVSAMVRTRVPDRADVISPGDPIRDDQGRVVGCNGFAVNEGFDLAQIPACEQVIGGVSPEQFAAEAAWCKADRQVRAVAALASDERRASAVPYKPSDEERAYLKRAERRVNLGQGNAQDRQALRDRQARKQAALGFVSPATAKALREAEDAERKAFRALIDGPMQGQQMSPSIWDRHFPEGV